MTASVASLRRWIRANLPEDARRAAVTVLRDTPPPGTEAQIDYGRLGMWLDPRTGKRRTVWAFVMVLAFSRYMFVRPTLRMDQHEWTAAHVEAFEFFGGVPARLVPDNLKTGVDKPDLYDPKINRSYAEFAAHYGVLIDPARALKPKDKPRVERPMPYVRDSLELWAAACIEAALPGVVADPYDDNSLSRMHDFNLLRGGIRFGACEVTVAADAEVIELWKLVNGNNARWIEPGLRGGWILSLSPHATSRG